nr:MAG TPA: hypothetical protein [Caudoviricetes sp.]
MASVARRAPQCHSPAGTKGPPPERVGVRVCVACASRVPGSGPRPGRWPRVARQEPV